MKNVFFIGLICFGWLCLLGCTSDSGAIKSTHKSIPQGKPFAEWSIQNPDYEGNPYDVKAEATFTHKNSGTEKTSLMFYSGQDSIWKFRFTGTQSGTWHFTTKGPGALGGKTGTLQVEASNPTRPGFFAGEGTDWVWQGTNKAFVPQMVMMGTPAQWWNGNKVDTSKINETINEFIVETGFTGFHFPGGGGWWFNINNRNTKDEDGNHIGNVNPDLRTFQVMEELLVRNYRQNGAAHIWMWGTDSHRDAGPEGIGGAMSEADQRILRYIAGRLGPIPGWSMGYGYDLYAWADNDELDTWYDSLKHYLGGWQHILGARADNYSANSAQMAEILKGNAELERNPATAVTWQGGDYIGHYDYRIGYPWYVEVLESFDKPQLQEDRFRIRYQEGFRFKDYKPGMTVRGLWHSTMSGGVGNIWGNLLPHNDNYSGSQPYDNKESTTIRGEKITVDIKDEIKTYSTFWFGKDRFSGDLIRSNALTGNEIGDDVLSENGPPISVCLRNEEPNRYIYYSESTQSVKMDLSNSSETLQAVAVDTRKPYEEIEIGKLAPESTTWEAPYASDWAIAVGEF